jgi:hypothetical protein
VLGDEEPLPAPPVYAFYGRAVMSVDFLRLIGDRMPGANGEQVVGGLIGFVPEGMTFAPTRRFHLSVARRFPKAFLEVPRLLDRLVADQDTWWQSAAFRAATLDEPAVLRFRHDVELWWAQTVVYLPGGKIAVDRSWGPNRDPRGVDTGVFSLLVEEPRRRIVSVRRCDGDRHR